MLISILICLLLMVGAALLLISFDCETPTLFLVSVCILAAGIGLWVYHDSHTGSNTEQNSSANSSNANLADVNFNDLSDNSNESTDDNSSNNDSNQAADDSSSKDSSKSSNSWLKNAKDTIDSAYVICNDGIQLKASVWQVDKNSAPSIVVVWPRLHQDGKPYSCSESKDPAKEVSL